MRKRKALVEPEWTCRVHPESRYLYYDVNIWSHKKDMIACLREWGMRGKCEAACCSIRREECRDNGTVRLLPNLGTIHLIKEYMPYPVIIHEIGHAAIEWGRRKYLNFNMTMEAGFTEVEEGEERILHAQSKMLFEFYTKYERRYGRPEE